MVGLEDNLLTALLGGEAVDRETALQVPTVAGGIDLIAGLIAGTPIKLYREHDGETEEVRDDYRLRLLCDETGDTLNANEFWRAMVRDYYLGKGGYAYINKRRGKIESLHYVDERRVSIIRNDDPIFKDFDIVVKGRTYRPFEFLRVLRNTRDGAEGCPITTESSELIDVAYQSLLFEARLVKKGGNKRGFLKSSKHLTEPSLEALKAGFGRMYNNNTENVVVLNDGLDFQETSNTSVEMQLNENKLSNAREFAKIFHVSPEAMTGQAGSNDISSLAKLAAIPLMVTIQCALNRDLLLEKEKGTYYWAFDTKELLKGDMRERFAAYREAIEGNFMQVDEVRYAEDLKPLGLTWIRLGLDDVLYDPRTKTIYTPNTNKTGVMGEAALREEPGGDMIEPRANPNHDPHSGQFISGPGGLTGGGKADKLQSSEKEEKSPKNSQPEWDKKTAEKPFDYFEMAGRPSNMPVHWKPKHFSSRLTKEQHEKHMDSVGAKTLDEYEQKAIDFIMSPRGAHGDAYITKSGRIGRYDYDTKEFAVAYVGKNVVATYWRLDKKDHSYWEGEKVAYGKGK